MELTFLFNTKARNVCFYLLYRFLKCLSSKIIWTFLIPTPLLFFVGMNLYKHVLQCCTFQGVEQDSIIYNIKKYQVCSRWAMFTITKYSYYCTFPFLEICVYNIMQVTLRTGKTGYSAFKIFMLRSVVTSLRISHSCSFKIKRINFFKRSVEKRKKENFSRICIHEPSKKNPMSKINLLCVMLVFFAQFQMYYFLLCIFWRKKHKNKKATLKKTHLQYNSS